MPEQVKKSLVLSMYFILAVSTLLVFWQVRNFDFINCDDNVYVYQNQHVLNGLTAKGVIWAFTTSHASNWHPLTWLSLMLDCQLFGANAGRIHLVNMLFHIANTLLLFTVLKKMTGSLWSSAFVAAAFALHPLHVESVAWIAERKDVLSTFFLLLTMWSYIHYVRQPKIVNYLLLVVFFAFGLMSKPMLVTLPFLLLLLDYWPLNRLGSKRSLSYLLIEKIPLFAMAAASSVVTFIVQKQTGAMRIAENISFPVRMVSAFISYVQYIVNMIWPVRLAIFYPHPGRIVSIFYPVISAIFLLVVTIVVIRFAKNRRYLFTGWFWYLGMLVPVMGIVQVGDQAMADRYTYMTLTGLFIIIAWGLPQLFSRWPHQKMVLGVLMVVVLTILGICAGRQVSYWNNNTALFSHAIEVTQNNCLAHNNRGVAYNGLGRYQEAVYDFKQAMKIKPHYAEAHNNLGAAYGKLGRYQQAIDAFTQAIEIKPDYAEAYHNLGLAYGNLSRYQDAIEVFRQAVKIQPNYAEVHFVLGFTYLKIRDKSSAMEEYKILKTLDAKKANILFNLINK